MTERRDERHAPEAPTEAPTEPLERGGGGGRGSSDVPLRGASHLKRNATLGKRRLGPLAEDGDPSEARTGRPGQDPGQGLIGWPEDEASGEAVRGTRGRGAEGGAHEPASALRSWGRYFAQNPAVALVCGLLVALAAVGVVSLAGMALGRGAAPADRATGADQGEAGEAPGDPSGDGSLGEAHDAGTIRVGRQDDKLTLSLAPGGGTYTGTFPEDGEGVELRSGRDGDRASFDSPYSEDGTRAYGGHIRGSLGANVVIDARPEFDPGKAAAAGWVPIAHGSYAVKARDGSFSAGGTYTDKLAASASGSSSGPPTVERTYTETFIRNTTGATHPQERSLRVRYSVEGEEETRLLGVALNPTLVGYRPPEGVESD